MRATVHVPDEIGKEMEKLAEDKGVSVSSLYAEAIEAHIKEERRKRAYQSFDWKCPHRTRLPRATR